MRLYGAIPAELICEMLIVLMHISMGSALTLVASRSGAQIGGSTALGVQHPRVDVVPSLPLRREVWVPPTSVGGGSRGNWPANGRVPLWESLACEFALLQDPSASVAAAVLRVVKID